MIPTADVVVSCEIHLYCVCLVTLFAAIHKTVSVVLLLGNMQFKQEKNSDQAVMPDDTGISLTLTS